MLAAEDKESAGRGRCDRDTSCQPDPTAELARRFWLIAFGRRWHRRRVPHHARPAQLRRKQFEAFLLEQVLERSAAMVVQQRDRATATACSARPNTRPEIDENIANESE
jgi:hypothetical protein